MVYFGMLILSAVEQSVADERNSCSSFCVCCNFAVAKSSPAIFSRYKKAASAIANLYGVNGLRSGSICVSNAIA